MERLTGDPGAGEGFDEDLQLDLTPRTGPETDDGAPAAARRRTPVGVWVVLAIVVVGVGFVVLRGLQNATVYFRTADEAVENRDELGTRRFRIEGEVQPGVEQDPSSSVVSFTIASNGVEVPVQHTGNAPDLFQVGIPVVLEGHFVERSDVFASDNMLVRHDSEYEAENPDRVQDYTDGEPDE
ncbi:MAG: cytochrome c maturation protein CcmE [Acidimicrobiales bacterium]